MHDKRSNGHTLGDWRQIGRNCLAEYFGIDAERIVSHCEYLDALTRFEQLGDGGWDDEYFDTGPSLIYLAEFSSFTAARIRTEGYVSATKADEGFETSCTGQRAESDYWAWVKGRLGKSDLPTDEDKALASKALAWARELEVTSNYEHNLKTIAEGSAINYRSANLAASMVSTYQRHIERTLRQGAGGEHVGTIGQRTELTVRTVRIIPTEGTYGLTNIHKFEDPVGNSLVWFASNGASPMALDKAYRGKATPKLTKPGKANRKRL